MILASPVLDTHALLELAYVSVIAGVGICAVYAIAVVGLTRSNEHRKAGRRRASALYAALGAIALAGCALAVVAGIAAMTSK